MNTIITTVWISSVALNSLRLHLDTANALAINNSQSDVAIVAPRSSPGVLDEPEVLIKAVIVAPSNEKHGVVESGATRSIVEDAALVGLEHVLVGFDNDSDRLLREGSFQLGHCIGFDESVFRD